MRDFFRDSLVKDYEQLIERMTNHPKDRHVLAAAVACRADYLVTFNLKHFSLDSVGTHGLTVIGPSTFLKQLVAINPAIVEERLCDHAKAIGVSIDDLLSRLAGSVAGFVSPFSSHESDRVTSAMEVVIGSSQHLPVGVICHVARAQKHGYAGLRRG